MFYKNHAEHVALLQQVMAATDADVEEEVVPGMNRPSGGSSAASRRNFKSFSSFSGGDNDAYMEFKSKSKVTHPLFKKFRTK